MAVEQHKRNDILTSQCDRYKMAGTYCRTPTPESSTCGTASQLTGGRRAPATPAHPPPLPRYHRTHHTLHFARFHMIEDIILPSRRFSLISWYHILIPDQFKQRQRRLDRYSTVRIFTEFTT